MKTSVLGQSLGLLLIKPSKVSFLVVQILVDSELKFTEGCLFVTEGTTIVVTFTFHLTIKS